MSDPGPKPIRGADETDVTYRLRVSAWRRKTKAYQRWLKDNPPAETEEVTPQEPEEETSLRETISGWFSKSEDALEEKGE